MTGYNEYAEAYGLLIELCERYVAMTDHAVLSVMEAFNIMAELGAPYAVPRVTCGEPDELVARVIHLLNHLTNNAATLHEALTLVRARDLLRTALAEQS
jgi:hypothetical protein